MITRVTTGTVIVAAALVLAGCIDRPAPAGTPTPSVRLTIVEEAPSGSSPNVARPTFSPPARASATRSAPWSRYAWVDDDNSSLIAVAATFTLVRGITPRQALRIVAPHPSTPIESPARAYAWQARQPSADSGPLSVVVGATSRAGWTLVLEDNAFTATELADRLSRDGTAVVIFNNVNGDTSFQFARRGRVLRYFDPLLYSDFTSGPRLPQERGIGFGRITGSYLARSLLLAQRLTGFEAVPVDLSILSYRFAVGTEF